MLLQTCATFLRVVADHRRWARSTYPSGWEIGPPVCGAATIPSGIDPIRPLFEIDKAPCRDYLSLLHQHIFKEDHVLFEMGDQVMNEGDQDELAESSCAAGCRAFGGKRHEELEALAETIESQYHRTSA